MCQNVLLMFTTDAKIDLIKSLRELTGLGLKAGKEAIEQGLVVSTTHVGIVVAHLHDAIERRNIERNANWQSSGRNYDKPATFALSIQVLPWMPKPQPVLWNPSDPAWNT